jgi:hypothetical protein
MMESVDFKMVRSVIVFPGGTRYLLNGWGSASWRLVVKRESGLDRRLQEGEDSRRRRQ